jgi:hypothetical protein
LLSALVVTTASFSSGPFSALSRIFPSFSRYGVYRRHHTGALAVLSLLVFTGLATVSVSAHADPVRAQLVGEADVGYMSGIRTGGSAVAPGFQFEVTGGPKRLPFMLGVSGGVYYPGSGSSNSAAYDGDHGYSLELRHIELTMRLEPDWERVRPFASASMGYASAVLTRGSGDNEEDTELDGALIRGVSLGLDFEPWKRSGNGGAVVFTVGVRGWETGQLRYDFPDIPSGAVRVVSPFFAITLLGWT